MRECPDCHKQFSSGNSYRVHKHKFHKQPKQVQEQLTVQPEAQPEEKKEAKETASKDESEDSGSLDWLIGIGVVAATILIMILGGRKQ